MHEISTLLKPSKEVKTWAETIVKELIKKGDFPQHIDNEEQLIKLNTVTHSDTTELDPLLPVMKAWKKLSINSVLSHLGFNSVQMLAATIVVVNRLLDPCSENPA